MGDPVALLIGLLLGFIFGAVLVEVTHDIRRRRDERRPLSLRVWEMARKEALRNAEANIKLMDACPESAVEQGIAYTKERTDAYNAELVKIQEFCRPES
jgi:hypothetical protein